MGQGAHPADASALNRTTLPISVGCGGRFGPFDGLQLLTMIPRTFFDWVDTTPLAALERDTTWGFAITSIFHLFGLILLFGAVTILSLRLFGWCMREQSISQVMRALWKWSVG